jgi:polyhydroxybutyrate depolymerase
MRRASSLLASLAALSLGLGACSSSGDSAPSTSSTAAGGAGGAGGATPSEIQVGGDRPATLYVPDAYRAGTPAPLLVMLHGYSVSGLVEDIYLGLRAVAAAKGFLYVHPDGTVDASGKRFWNATDGCCDEFGSHVDDVAYLTALVAEIGAKVDVDPKRVYFVGHSNGGFMSHRMACDRAGLVAAIGSLAGAEWLDASKCKPSEPVAALEIHGDADADVLYGGDPTYPSAPTTVKDWATLDGCVGGPVDGGTLDLDEGLPGAETAVSRYTGCKPDGAAELWTIHGGTHLPSFGPAFLEELTSFLLAHPKP